MDRRGVVSSVESPLASAWLAVRSAFWTVAFPGTVAGYIPWTFFGLSRKRVNWVDPFDAAAVLCIGLGVALLAACIVEFARRGKGTLSPADPPRSLVVSGLYKYVRNPMYLSVTIILLGEVLLVRAPALAWYWAGWFAAVNLFVLAYEEPTLRGTFGESYDEYRSGVGRWIPRTRALKEAARLSENTKS